MVETFRGFDYATTSPTY